MERNKEQLIKIYPNERDKILAATSLDTWTKRFPCCNKPKLVMIGCGGVGKGLLELMPHYCSSVGIDLPWKDIVIIEPKELDLSHEIFSAYNVIHRRVGIEKSNIDAVLGIVACPGDMICDVSVGVDALAVMAVADRLKCTYANTSMENWDCGEDAAMLGGNLAPRTLAYRLDLARRRKYKMTVLIDHGMNPGLISHFAKRALLDIAKYEGERYIDGKWAKLSKELGVQTIHIAEIDTQTTNLDDNNDVFRNTWSAEGFVAEALDPIQVGFGTHEKQKGPIPLAMWNGEIKEADFVKYKNTAYTAIRGMDAISPTCAPDIDGKVVYVNGFMIPHGEANTLSALLSIDGYRPSVYYVYRPNVPGSKSIEWMRSSGYKMPREYHVFQQNEIEQGYDAIGTLMLRHNKKHWWCGTILTHEQVKQMGIRWTTCTLVQVAISLMAALFWIKDNPHKGLITPEDIPHDEIFKICEPYLGLIYSDYIDFDGGDNTIPGISQ